MSNTIYYLIECELIDGSENFESGTKKEFWGFGDILTEKFPDKYLSNIQDYRHDDGNSKITIRVAFSDYINEYRQIFIKDLRSVGLEQISVTSSKTGNLYE